MHGLNEYIPVRVPTHNGMKELSQIVPGDKVFEYKSGRLLQVQEIIRRSVHDIWELEYTDGRKMMVDITSKVFTGDNVMSLITALESNGLFFVHTEQYPVELKGSVHKPLFPDPYIAGALITHGNFDDEYLNLPLDRDGAGSLFGDKYRVDHADKLGDNTVYFYWKAVGRSEVPITWKEFFPDHNFYPTTGRVCSPIIPDEYKYGSTKERIQFIRGAFDVGYSPDMFPDNAGIAHKYEEKLKEIQEILWSLGVVSTVSYDPTLPLARGRIFRLDVKRNGVRYPGFFYDIMHMEHQILNRWTYFHYHDTPFELKVCNAKRVAKGWMCELVLPSPEMIYLDDKFLPRVSI